MPAMPINDLAHLLIHAKPGPEDLLADWVAANRAARAARIARNRAPNNAVAKEVVATAEQARQKARLAYLEGARVTPLEAAENMQTWLDREGNLEKDMARLGAQMREL